MMVVDADHGRDATGVGRPDHVCKRLPVGRRVLEVDDHVVHPGAGKQLDHLGGGKRHVRADDGLPRLQLRLQPRPRLHPSPPFSTRP
jgi:hypothetical protein